MAGTVNWTHVETNRPSSDLTSTIITDCTFDSTDPTDLLPDYFDAADFNEIDFIYAIFGFVNSGSGVSTWLANNYNYGIYNTLRDGIGFFYFYTTLPGSEYESIDAPEACTEDDFERVQFWDYLSTFWNFLEDDSRDMTENFWFGLVIAGGSLVKKGLRFLAAVNPEEPGVCPFEDYYDLQVGPLYSRPVFLDPTLKSPKSIINPIGTVLIEPTYDSDLSPIYNDLIEVRGNDYEQIRYLGYRSGGKIVSECYVVITPKDTSLDTKWFPVTDFYASSEAYDREAWAIISGTSSQGALRIESVDTTDVSQYKITITGSAGGPTAVAWTATSLDITFDNTSLTQIADVLAAVATGTPWATLSDISDPVDPSDPSTLKTDCPEVANEDFEDLDSYVNAQTGEGRYYPDTAKVWKWYPGWSDSTGTVGTDSQGYWAESRAKFKYMIEVEGSLNYLGVETFSIYLTTGKSYDINNEVLDIPYLTTGIEIPGTQFDKETDFVINSYVLEFNRDIFVNDSVEIDSYLYSKKTPIIERYLFDQHGGMVGINQWAQYEYKNIPGKAALNTLLSSMRDSSTISEYQKALNVYYGLPVSPEKCKTVGLFESYGYKIIDVSNPIVTLEIKDDEELHPFIQNHCTMINDSGKGFSIENVINPRTSGKIQLSGDFDELSYGDHLYLRLNNRFPIKNIYANSGSSAPYIDVYIPEGYKPVQHIIDTVYGLYGKYPELIIHGTESNDINYNGLYHATNAATHPLGFANVVRITLYAPDEATDPLYNDYVETTYLSEPPTGTCLNESLTLGFAHMCWPTHKFLYLYMMESDRLYRAYMDSPMDTIYDAGDTLQQYQIICRNASVLNGGLFPHWNQYMNFRRSPGINVDTDIVELVFADSSAKFGQYFPSGYIVL